MFDVNTARSLYTVLCFVSFLLIVYVAYNRRARKRYDDIAQKMIDDNDLPENPAVEPPHSTHDNGAK